MRLRKRTITLDKESVSDTVASPVFESVLVSKDGLREVMDLDAHEQYMAKRSAAWWKNFLLHCENNNTGV